MKVSEIFPSLQGEGLLMGIPTTFIRFTGCNLRCVWCDTKYAYDEGEDQSVDDIVNAVSSFGIKRVCLTGGEPLLQKELMELINALVGFEISVETNGSLDISPLLERPGVLISLDIKCPSSEMMDSNLFDNISKLRGSDQMKFVIKDENDYDYAKMILEKYVPQCSIIFTPVGGVDELDDREVAKASSGAEERVLQRLAELVLQDGLTEVRVLPQLHKLIWPNDDRGR